MNVYKKLSEIQRELHAPKGQTNKFGNYNYRSCEDILQAVKPLLGDYALTITDELIFSGMLEDEIPSTGVIVKTQRVYIKATVTLSDGTDTITTSAMAREASIKKGMDSSQVSGAASSYARKYALNGLFAIDDNKDADTDQHRKVVDAGLDMTLEGIPNQSAQEPQKRIDKVRVQKIVSEIVDALNDDDDVGLKTAAGKLESHEKTHVWSQFNSTQQKKIRAVTFNKEAA